MQINPSCFSRPLIYIGALLSILGGTLLSDSSASAEPQNAPLDIDITHTDIEDLLKITVTSVSRIEQSAWAAPAAVFVLTNEDIKRSGATTIPDALRMVPGIQVARISADKWAVSARGFNSGSANKLQVLIDGRSVYDLLYSGVLWENKDVMFEDVDRIEVIRGPAGTIWGANAVNGVINIVTKSAKDTQGSLVTAGGGTEELGFGSARYGTEIGQDRYMRIYAKGNGRGSGYAKGGANDESQLGQAGFRIDGQESKNDKLTVQGDYFTAEQGIAGSGFSPHQFSSGGNLLLNWEHKYSSGSSLNVLTYLDHSEIDNPALGEVRNTGYAKLEYLFAPFSGHHVVTGFDYRHSPDSIRNTARLSLEPQTRSDNRVSGFIEDTIDLAPDTLFLILGSKFEENNYTGFEYQPTARLSWSIDEKNLLWLGVSRAVRVPSRLENDLNVEIAPGSIFRGNRAQWSEVVVAYELGYRVQPMQSFFLDLTTFYNNYDRLITVEGLTIGNKGSAKAYGAESAMMWQALDDWQVKVAYTFFTLDMGLDEDSVSPRASTLSNAEGSSPDNGLNIQSRYTINSQWSFDLGIRYVDSIRSARVGSYIVGDARIGYHADKNLELELVGQNLFENQHYEFGPGASSTEVQQGVYGKATWRF